MAFNTNTAAAPAQTNNDNWKAQGFINLYLPPKGGRRKLGAISLKVNKASEKQLIEWLEADEKNVDVLASKLIVEYNPATASDANAFDLG